MVRGHCRTAKRAFKKAFFVEGLQNLGQTEVSQLASAPISQTDYNPGNHKDIWTGQLKSFIASCIEVLCGRA